MPPASKPCAVCGHTITWRTKWERDWAEVRYCSDACRQRAKSRPATAQDEAALGRLGALLVELHHAFDPQRFIPAGPGTAKGYGRWLVGQSRGADTLVLVAEGEGGEMLGYAYAGVEGTDWMNLRGPAGVVHDLVVDPAHRGQGHGRALLEAAAAALAQRGAPRVVLSTAAGNEAAQRLFARAGFRPTMVEMTRELPEA